jgi:protein-S-isoprenylcysteine O-methyltransferase Ste14
MHLIGNHLLGIIIMVLFSLQGIVMFFSPGSIRLQKPQGGIISWLYNILNLIIILVITPLAAILLMKKVSVPIELTWINVGNGWVLFVLETAGILCFFSGNILQYWSRIFLGRSFRLGAVAPRSEDKFVSAGPYRLVRHPMYSAVLLMSLGLGLMIQSFLILILSVALAVFIMLMIPAEEAQLRGAYGDEYRKYRERVKALIPFIY